MIRHFFRCGNCGKTFKELEGQRYHNGDVDQWCPNCGETDDNITAEAKLDRRGKWVVGIIVFIVVGMIIWLGVSICYAAGVFDYRPTTD